MADQEKEEKRVSDFENSFGVLLLEVLGLEVYERANKIFLDPLFFLGWPWVLRELGGGGIL